MDRNGNRDLNRQYGSHRRIHGHCAERINCHVQRREVAVSVAAIKKKSKPVPIERRVDFPEWRDTVEGRFDTQDKILKDQADTLNKIDNKLDLHIETTRNWKNELRPVVEAFGTMQQGVQVIGKVGSAVGWVGKKIAVIAAGVAAVLGALLAWHQWWVK